LRRIAAFCLALAISGVLAAEALVRAAPGPELRFRLAERELHCLDADSGDVLLCADRRVNFAHPTGFEYRVTTNARGERDAYQNDPVPPSAQSAVWLLGDSIAMGFGNDDAEILAYSLARALPKYYVRNLGVDSLGACGIRRVFQRALTATRASSRSTPETTQAGREEAELRPRHIIWIFNPSDYTDDVRDQRRQASVLRRVSFALRFQVTKTLALPDFLRSRFAGSSPAPGGPAPFVAPGEAPGDPEHPTYVCAREIFALGRSVARRDGGRFTLLVYPDVDRRTGAPLHHDPLKQPIIDLAAEFPELRVLDLQPLFEKHRHRPELYLRGDGHPGPGAQDLFHLGVLPILD
jgi:hypothetical protein